MQDRSRQKGQCGQKSQVLGMHRLYGYGEGKGQRVVG